MDIEIIKPLFKYFECSRCSFSFVKKINESVSGIVMCVNCEYPCIDYRLKGRRLTDEEVLIKLPEYSRMKYYWMSYPKSWEDNIKHRTTQNLSGGNKKTWIKDNSGHRIGELPEIVEVICW